MIHYHGLPMSGGDQSTLSMQGKHTFVSFAHGSVVELAAEVSQSFALDNGAYTAWKGGKAFDIEGYAAFVSSWARHPGFDFYIIPDVIDGDYNDNARMRAAWRNQCDYRIWNQGVPVWHFHEPLEILRELCHAFNRVAIGSSGEYSVVGSTAWWGRIAEAMPFACDEDGKPISKLHGLRMLDPTIFSHLPLSSADSTNVARNCGIDKRWRGPYAPRSARTRALVMMERIEAHGSAARWAGSTGLTQNLELIG